MRDDAGTLCQFGQAFFIARQGVDNEPFLAQPLGDRVAHAGRRAGDESGSVI